MQYVGQRQDFTAAAYGTPDACSSGGQELRASSYDWSWDFDTPTPNYVLQGYIDGFPPFTPLAELAKPNTVVDTMPFPKTGCTSSCLLAGSQNALPQCGDGKVDAKYESCDNAADIASGACTQNCLMRGNTAANGCGDSTVDASKGEECDKIPDPQNGGALVFPPGCKAPDTHVDGFADNIGCIETGSSTVTGSRCGDGILEDGEECDDGNTSNGDGCSSDCLKEGSLRSCLDVAAGQPCVNVCGNGKVEPGEDPACEPNPNAAGCNPKTCLKLGTPTCPAGGGSNCCGNGVVDPGEDPACETDPLHAEFCTANCLLKGSSAFYTNPSFCADGIAEKGRPRSASRPTTSSRHQRRRSIRTRSSPPRRSRASTRTAVPRT